MHVPDFNRFTACTTASWLWFTKRWKSRQSLNDKSNSPRSLVLFAQWNLYDCIVISMSVSAFHVPLLAWGRVEWPKVKDELTFLISKTCVCSFNSRCIGPHCCLVPWSESPWVFRMFASRKCCKDSPPQIKVGLLAGKLYWCRHFAKATAKPLYRLVHLVDLCPLNSTNIDDVRSKGVEVTVSRRQRYFHPLKLTREIFRPLGPAILRKPFP